MSTPNSIFLVWGFHDYEGAFHYTGYEDREAAIEHAERQYEQDSYCPNNMGVLELFPGDAPGSWYVRETDIRYHDAQPANEYWEVA